MLVTQHLKVGEDPDVLAWDPGWQRLYVAVESGVFSRFREFGDTLLPLCTVRIPHAHTAPRTHRNVAAVGNGESECDGKCADPGAGGNRTTVLRVKSGARRFLGRPQRHLQELLHEQLR
jgi:hypothetical protein